MRPITHVVIALIACPAASTSAQPVVSASDLFVGRYAIGVGANPEIVLDAVMDGAFAFGRVWILERSRLLALGDDGALVDEVGQPGSGSKIPK